MYQALYRKWRPKTFDEVVGQPQVTETLKRQLVTGRLSHAYLFIGTRGTGKTSCAKILAKAVNCEAPIDGNPCNACPSCLGIDNGSILDVEELDAASNNGVDNVRALRDEAVFTPAQVKKRVYIIDEVHMLSTSAFNALLKILEEPPEHLMFILATTDGHKVPATILSRCQRYAFKRVSPENIANRLLTVSAAEGLGLTEDAAALLARLSDGSVRDGMSLLDQCADQSPIDSDAVLAAAGLIGSMKTAELFGRIAAGDTEAALLMLDELYVGGKDVASVLNELSTLVRDLALVQIAPRGGAALLSGGYDGQTLRTLSGQADVPRLMGMLAKLNAALSEMAKSTDRRLTAELCLIGLSGVAVYTNPGPAIPRQPGAVLRPAAQKPAPSEPEADAPPFDTDPAAPSEPVPESEEPEFEEPEPQEVSPESVPPATGGADIWPQVLALVQNDVDMAVHMILADSGQTSAKYTGGELLVYFDNDFSMGMAGAAPVLAALKKAAESVVGAKIPVRLLTGEKPPAAKADKLDKLSKFDHIKFT